MPRHQTASTTTLEQADLEPTPFDGVEMPTHDDRLAALDARDDALNGRGVRPSEQCGVLAGSGPYPGRRCTYAEHPMNQPHSWEVSTEPPADEVGHVYDDSAQPTLPGTPEPEENEYTVPHESTFGKGKLLPAPGLKTIAERLIEDDEELEHLVGVEIRYAWRRRGGMQGGNPRYARIKRPSIWESHFSGGKVEFLVDVSADHVRDFKFTPHQIEAAIHECLSRTARDEDNHDAFRIAGPDFQGSIRTLDRYGTWRPDLREMRAHVAKLPMEEAIEEANDDADDSESEEE
jgi:hypothetical protein